jgi:DNA-binding MarR family transcriptional regulator
MVNSSKGDAVFTYFNEIGIISQLSTVLFEQSLSEGLTLSQFSVLNWFVRVDVEATPGRLARAFQVTGGAMTNTLKKLESKGLVKVEPDKNSGRRKRVTMTRKGNQVRDGAIKAVAPLLRNFSERFPVEKLGRQTLQLSKVREYLDECRSE